MAIIKVNIKIVSLHNNSDNTDTPPGSFYYGFNWVHSIKLTTELFLLYQNGNISRILFFLPLYPWQQYSHSGLVWSEYLRVLLIVADMIIIAVQCPLLPLLLCPQASLPSYVNIPAAPAVPCDWAGGCDAQSVPPAQYRSDHSSYQDRCLHWLQSTSVPHSGILND